MNKDIQPNQVDESLREGRFVSMFAESFSASLHDEGLVLCAPNALYDYRIPALASNGAEVYLFFDERPRAACANWEEVGGFMPEDLPNPNKILYMRAPADDLTAWSSPRVLPTPQSVCGDAAVVVRDGIFELLYVANDTVGYFGSAHDGDRLHLWYGWGTDVTSLSYVCLDELYERTGADGIFATSGSGVIWQGNATFPLVTRRGDTASLYIVQVRAGEIIELSEPLRVEGAELDETALCVHEGVLYASCRLQARGGRVTFESRDGVHFVPSEAFSCLVPRDVSWGDVEVVRQDGDVCPREVRVADPGCNACLISRDGMLTLVHPQDASARTRGSIMRSDGASVEIVSGDFGYSDYVKTPTGEVYVVYERTNELVLRDITPEIEALLER